MARVTRERLVERWRRRTPAWIGVGRAGAHYRTETLLAFRERHARARDAVWSELPASFARRLGLIEVSSRATSKQEYLLHPELGRRLAPADRRRLTRIARRGSAVQVVVVDGLSARAVETQAPRLLPGLLRALEGHTLGTPVLVRRGRVAVADEVGEAVSADVTVAIVGERPGLVTAESVGAYVTYAPRLGRTDAERDLLANIHDGGTPPAKAIGVIAAMVEKALRQRRTGVLGST